MHYLECITLLNYLLEKLNVGQRTQVPISVCDEIMSVLLQINKKLENKPQDAMLVAALQDVYLAASAAKQTLGVLVLTDAMKCALTDGLMKIKRTLAIVAYRYFQHSDTIPDEPSKELVKVLRDVVSVAAEEGLV